MAQYFEDQSLLKIVLDTEIDISTAGTLKVLYKKPDGTSGSWDAVLEGTTQMSYQIQPNDIDQNGVWKFQAYVVIGTLEGYGKIVSENIKKPIVTL